jgi:CHASE3 domain sensor protein
MQSAEIKFENYIDEKLEEAIDHIELQKQAAIQAYKSVSVDTNKDLMWQLKDGALRIESKNVL